MFACCSYCDILKKRKCINSDFYAHNMVNYVVLMNKPTGTFSKLPLFLIPMIRYLIRKMFFFFINKLHELFYPVTYEHDI